MPKMFAKIGKDSKDLLGKVRAIPRRSPLPSSQLSS
jgi:hypothetical protein